MFFDDIANEHFLSYSLLRIGLKVSLISCVLKLFSCNKSPKSHIPFSVTYGIVVHFVGHFLGFMLCLRYLGSNNCSKIAIFFLRLFFPLPCTRAYPVSLVLN